MPNNDLPRDPNADDTLEQLGRLTLTDHSMESLLQSVADLAKTVMPGNPEASITVQSQGRKTTVVSTGQLATDLDEVQYAEGYGPCLHAATTQQMVEIPDTRVEARWPDYARRAVEHGNLSSLSMPLGIDERRSGALNIYAREPHAFDADSRAAATRFAPYAAVALANMHAYEDARTMAGNLRIALDSRAVIDQAKGILMERFKLTADQAFQALARVSMMTNQKVRDVAERFVHTGQLPDA